MTTTVKRGAGRPAATARSKKTNQNTPLPPRPGQVQDARDVIAEIQPEVNGYGKMTQAQLLKVAQDLGLTPPKSAPKGKLLEAILAKEQANVAERKEALAEAKADQAMRKPALDKKLDEAFTPAEVAEASKRLDSKSGAKAEAFIAEAMRLGWTATATLGSTGRLVVVVASRDEERITIEWVDGVFQDNCTYQHAERTPLKVRNASAAKARMAVAPAVANEEAQKVTAHKATRASVNRPAPSKQALPFDPALATDEEVLTALQGTRITWANSVSGEPEEATIRPRQKITMRHDKKGRNVTFNDANGARSVRLTALLSVRQIREK